MEREGRSRRVIPIREQRVVKCQDCGNDNLLHGLTLAKASMVGMIGGPKQLPNFIGEGWAVYYCLACESFFPYPKAYPLQPQFQAMYKNILEWCQVQAQLRKQRKEKAERLVSIIESNKDLLGLPGQREDNLEQALKPMQDKIDSLEREIRAKKGGRPKHCKVKDCKVKAEFEGYCKAHFLEKNHE